MRNALVLGASGMLGSMVFAALRASGEFNVCGTVRGPVPDVFRSSADRFFPFDALQEPGGQLRTIGKSFTPDFVINCIGIIKPYCKDDDMAGVVMAIRVNSLFPHLLAGAVKQVFQGTKVIQIATDCVFSGSSGKYDESAKHDALDVYGKTKSLGEVVDPGVLNIRCSIIGPELKGKLSLLEWFLAQPRGVRLKGFSHHEWNGVTTLQFAHLCRDLMKGDAWNDWRSKGHTLHYVPNETVTKYKLLLVLREVYGRDVTIDDVSNIGLPVLRTLTSRLIPTSTLPLLPVIAEMDSIWKGLEGRKQG